MKAPDQHLRALTLFEDFRQRVQQMKLGIQLPGSAERGTGLVFVDSLASQGTYNVNTGLWMIGDMPNYSAASLTLTGQLPLGSNGTSVDPDLIKMMRTLGAGRLQIVTDHKDAAKEYLTAAAAWIREGSLRFEETYVDGLDNAVDAFLDLHRGANIGKMLVRL